MVIVHPVVENLSEIRFVVAQILLKKPLNR